VKKFFVFYELWLLLFYDVSIMIGVRIMVSSINDRLMLLSLRV